MVGLDAIGGESGHNADEHTATLTMPDGSQIQLPVLKDASGSSFVDIRRLHPTTGICTFDPGFGSTASCESSITYIDGNKGQLEYRGEAALRRWLLRCS
jgi:citrate synthase